MGCAAKYNACRAAGFALFCSVRRTYSTASLMILTEWNLSKVIVAFGRFSAMRLMKAGLMSMQTSLIASGLPPMHGDIVGEGGYGVGVLASVANTTRARSMSTNRVT